MRQTKKKAKGNDNLIKFEKSDDDLDEEVADLKKKERRAS